MDLLTEAGFLSAVKMFSHLFMPENTTEGIYNLKPNLFIIFCYSFFL